MIARMQKAILIPSRSQVDKAGDVLRKSAENTPEYQAALNTLTTWRSAHSYVLNTFQALLRSKSRAYKGVVIAQRLKRLPSILTKLNRFKVRMSQVQDIAGLRVILPTVEDVYKFHSALAKAHGIHEPKVPPTDYIQRPKPDGYKSIHQIFRYRSKDHESLNVLAAEIQIRSRLQHAWATAVETLGAIEHESFKTGDGSEKYKQFFKLSSALISYAEHTPVLEEMKGRSKAELIDEFIEVEKSLNVFQKLNGVTVAAKHIEDPGSKEAYYHLMVLDTASGTLSLTPFTKTQSAMAEKMYTLLEASERENSEKLIVLVSAGDLKGLRKAYPNYFLDTKLFVDTLKKICAGR